VDGREWVQLIASLAAALCAAAAWHAARINATTLAEVKRDLDDRWLDSVDTVGREQRALGKLEGGMGERLDHEARLERARVNNILVTELPSEKRRADGAE